jgi:hypothetical protein
MHNNVAAGALMPAMAQPLSRPLRAFIGGCGDLMDLTLGERGAGRRCTPPYLFRARGTAGRPYDGHTGRHQRFATTPTTAIDPPLVRRLRRSLRLQARRDVRRRRAATRDSRGARPSDAPYRTRRTIEEAARPVRDLLRHGAITRPRGPAPAYKRYMSQAKSLPARHWGAFEPMPDLTTAADATRAASMPSG